MRRLTELALWLVVFTIPWDEAVALGQWGTLSRLFGYVAVGAGLLTVFASAVSYRHLSQAHIAAVAFAVWSFISVGWAADEVATLGRVLTLFRVIGLAWLVWQFAPSRQKQSALMNAFVLGCFVPVAAVFQDVASGAGAAAGGRHTGVGMNPNGLATLFAVSIVMAFWQVREAAGRRRMFRYVYSLYIGLAGVAVLLTGSRGGLIALITGVAWLAVVRTGRSPIQGAFLLALAGAGLYGATRLLPESTSNRLLNTPEEIRSGTWSERRDINKVALDLFIESPVVGYGSGTFFWTVAPRYGKPIDAHNTYTGVAVETGAIGVGLYLLVWGLLFHRVRALPAVERSVWQAILMIWLVAQLSSTLDFAKSTWFILGLGIARSSALHSASRRSAAAKMYKGVGETVSDTEALAAANRVWTASRRGHDDVALLADLPRSPTLIANPPNAAPPLQEGRDGKRTPRCERDGASRGRGARPLDGRRRRGT